MLRKFNVWFDSVKEPRRFFYFIGWMIVMLAMLAIPHPIFSVIGGAMLLTAIIVGFSRIL